MESNVGYQRNLARSRVELYASENISGNWQLTGQPIIFNQHGEMIDGQHRCAAVIMAEHSIDSLVVEGIEAEAYSALDQGKQRGAADVLKIAGYSNVTLTAAVARCIINYQASKELHGKKTAVSSMRVLAFVKKNDHTLSHIVSFFTGLNPYTRVLQLGSSLPALQWILANGRVPQGLIDEFIDKMLYGENLKRADPIYQLREALIYSSQHPTHRMQLRTKDARLIKTWNAFRLNDAGPQVTRWNPVTDDYPEIAFKAP